MKIKLLFGYELNCYLNRQYWREGIDSQKDDNSDNHIIIWDFDNANPSSIATSLEIIQKRYCLPTIYILESSIKHYHAYCFASRSLKDDIHIISDTPFVCETFLRLGMVRGYYTLRISQRSSEDFKLRETLVSDWPNEMLSNETTLSKYITYNGGK